MKRDEILDTAKEYVTKDRAATHGDMEDNFAMIGKLWSLWVGVEIKTHDVAAMMAFLKLARIKFNPGHADNWVDGVGYLSCGGEHATKSDVPERFQEPAADEQGSHGTLPRSGTLGLTESVLAAAKKFHTGGPVIHTVKLDADGRPSKEAEFVARTVYRKIQCGNCKSSYPESKPSCPYCGVENPVYEPLISKRFCSSCGHVYSTGMANCPNCKHPNTAPEKKMDWDDGDDDLCSEN